MTVRLASIALFVPLVSLGAVFAACEGTVVPFPDGGSPAPSPTDGAAPLPDSGGPPCKSIGDTCISNTECCTSICTTKIVVEAGTTEPTRCAATP